MKPLIDELYAIFPARPQLCKQLNACNCCMLPEEQEQLRKSPQRKIDAKLLYNYNCAVELALPEGNDKELKHFLPRMLELALEEVEIAWDPSINFKRYENLPRESWSEAETNILEKVALARLSTPKALDFLEELRMFNALPINLPLLLNKWSQSLTPSKLLNIKNILDHEHIWKQEPYADKAHGFLNIEDDLYPWLFDPKFLQDIQTQLESLLLTAEWKDEFNMLFEYVAILREQA